MNNTKEVDVKKANKICKPIIKCNTNSLTFSGIENLS